jgi:hypothetical protein
MHRTRTLITAGAFAVMLAVGAAVVPAYAAVRPNDCCAIPPSETIRPVSPAPTFGIPTGETLNPCHPTIGRRCP